MRCVEATRRHIVFPRVDELVFKLRFFYQRTFSPRLKKNVYDNQEYFFIGFSNASSHCIFTIRVECVLTVLKYHFSIYFNYNIYDFYYNMLKCVYNKFRFFYRNWQEHFFLNAYDNQEYFSLDLVTRRHMAFSQYDWNVFSQFLNIIVQYICISYMTCNNRICWSACTIN